MSSVFGFFTSGVVPFVILLSALVFIHELGHFFVARLCGVRVEVFSIGFGKKILKYKKGDTIYCVSLIPFGGYVKMFGEQPGADIPEADKSVSYTHKNVWQRIAIVLAGPLMNFFFAVAIFGTIAYTGEEVRSSRVAEVKPDSVAEKAGIKSNDLIVAVNGTTVRSYEEFQKTINNSKNQNAVLDIKRENNQDLKIEVPVTTIKNPNIFTTDASIGQIDGILPYTKGTLVAVTPDSAAAKLGFKTGNEIKLIDGKKAVTWYDLNRVLDGKEHEVVLTDDKKITITAGATFKNVEAFGFEHPEMYLEQVVPDSPAAQADIHKYDKIVAINGKKMTSWEDILNLIKSYDGKDALMITLLRDGAETIKKVTPQMTSQMTPQGQEDKRFTIGIIPMMNYSAPEVTKISEDSLFGAVGKGFSRSWEISTMTVMSFVRMFQGQVSHKNIGGLISIGKAAKDSYAMGVQAFMVTMAILSISLFVLNLLPVPVLDGGHLVFYAIEAIKGSPLSVKKMEIAHQVGFVLLMGLMVLALFNDFTKFLFKS